MTTTLKMDNHYKIRGVEWTFFFANENSPRPGPTFITKLHSWTVTVYRRPDDGLFHFTIGWQSGEFLYRSSWDKNYVPSEDVFIVLDKALERALGTAIP